MSSEPTSAIKRIDVHSVHKITSGQVVIDLQTAVKELVENSLDAGATNIDVRFKECGLKTIEVIDNGCGIAPEDYSTLALKHHTSKLSTFHDLSTVLTYGFRGEALSSLCALSDELTVATCTADQAGLGSRIELDSTGSVRKVSKVSRQRGTTITVTHLFKPLPVRRKEFERNLKREFGKALGLLTAYALVPCVRSSHSAPTAPDSNPDLILPDKQEKKGVRLTVSNQAADGGRKTTHITAPSSTSLRSSVSSLWGPKALDHLVDLDLTFSFTRERLDRNAASERGADIEVRVVGLISKFDIGHGRTGTDRQFFYVNGRPWTGSKVQKVFNEVYRSFNVNQLPFIIADFLIPTAACDINVSPDKRTIFLHGENHFLQALKVALEEDFAPSRSTYDVGAVSQKKHVAASQMGKAKRKQNECSDAEGGDESQEDSQLSFHSEDTGLDVVSASVPILPTPGSPSHSGKLLEDEGGQAIDATLAAETLVEVEQGDGEVPRDGKNRVVDAETFSSSSTLAPAPASAPGGSSSKRRYVQTTLDTTGAVWSRRVQRGEERGRDELSSLKKRSDDGGISERGKNTRRVWSVPQSMKAHLSGFARGASLASGEDGDVDMVEDPDEEGIARDETAGVVGRKRRRLSSTGGESPLAGDAQDERKEMDVDELVDDGTMDVDYDEAPQSVESGLQANLTDDGSDRSEDTYLLESGTTGESHQDILTQPEVIRTVEGGQVSLRFDISKISAAWGRLREGTAVGSPGAVKAEAMPPEDKVPAEAGVSNTEDDGKAADALARVIDKQDFEAMEIVGQFNRGFIVVRRQKVVSVDEGGGDGVGTMDDLFIVDQHAADEKYNFETLQQTTKIRSQKLLRPLPLELTAADELLAADNLEVLRQNGFEVGAEEEADGKPHRLSLVAQPVSRSTMFDVKDLEELIHLMHDRPSGQMVRCSKARAMFAMRACRKSVMVGMPLNKSQMTTVVQHMGMLDQPWNCPHGRPTMRHLSDLASALGIPEGARSINWTKFGMGSV